MNRPIHDAIRRAAYPLADTGEAYAPLMELIGEAPIVLIGEASHGTHDFYRVRAEITMELIYQKGFDAVAVEADWPDAFRVNRFVRGRGDDATPDTALGAFERFPRWMWRNHDVLEFLSWLHAYNAGLPRGAVRTGFYGLDLYSLHASMQAVIGYLLKVDPEAARRASERYSCFEHFGEAQEYGRAIGYGEAEPCEQEVVAQLVELRERAAELAIQDGRASDEEFFSAEQNARLARNAEEYYRAMFRGRVSSWNLRDTHMGETLGMLIDFLGRKSGRPAKVVVWEHNSHLGDARATEMGDHGELNVGQLARERYGRDAVLIGFTTYQGTVTAASDWDNPAERKRVRPALPGSYELLFHEVGVPRFLLPLRDAPIAEQLRSPRLERAIGVVYRPETERWSHYFQARLADQFDAVIHLDETSALVPLDRTSGWEEGELPDTYPFAV
jgi:erythromycin esterase-like protein